MSNIESKKLYNVQITYKNQEGKTCTYVLVSENVEKEVEWFISYKPFCIIQEVIAELKKQPPVQIKYVY